MFVLIIYPQHKSCTHLEKRALQTTNGNPPEKTRGHGNHCYNEISTHPPLPELPKNPPRIPV